MNAAGFRSPPKARCRFNSKLQNVKVVVNYITRQERISLAGWRCRDVRDKSDDLSFFQCEAGRCGDLMRVARIVGDAVVGRNSEAHCADCERQRRNTLRYSALRYALLGCNGREFEHSAVFGRLGNIAAA